MTAGFATVGNGITLTDTAGGGGTITVTAMNFTTPRGMSRRHFMQHLAGASALAGPALALETVAVSTALAPSACTLARPLSVATAAASRRVASMWWCRTTRC